MKMIVATRKNYKINFIRKMDNLKNINFSYQTAFGNGQLKKYKTNFKNINYFLVLLKLPSILAT